MTANKRVTFAARWTADDLAAIKQRAADAELSMTEYVRRAALGIDGDQPAQAQIPWSVESRLTMIERRIQRLEARP